MTPSGDTYTEYDLPHGVRLLHVVSAEDYPPAGGAFVWNEKGLNRLCWCEDVNHQVKDSYDRFLMLGDVPLLQWHSVHGGGTCEQLLQAGNTPLAEVKQFAEAINGLSNEMGLVDCLAALSSVIQLLQTGLYFVAWDEYSPTNGEGHFFWRAFGELNPCDSLREKWFEDEINRPAFLVPTQSTANFDQARYNSARLTFRNHPGLALHIGGRMAALLDGHHRATCAAMNGERFHALTISSAYVNENQGERYLVVQDIRVPCAEVASETRSLLLAKQTTNHFRSNCDTQRIHREVGHAALQRVVWPELPKHITSVINPANYLSDAQYDLIASFSRRGETIEQSIVEDALTRTSERYSDRETLRQLLLALFEAKDPRAATTALRVAQSLSWTRLWDTAYSLLSTVRSEEVENQFVQFLINDDGSRPEIKAIVDRYFQQHE